MHLKTLEHYEVIFHNRQQHVFAGEIKNEKITEWISRSNIFLLFLSADYVSVSGEEDFHLTHIHSRFTNEGLEVTVIPVFLRFCDGDEVINKFNGVVGFSENDQSRPLFESENLLGFEDRLYTFQQNVRKFIEGYRANK